MNTLQQWPVTFLAVLTLLISGCGDQTSSKPENHTGLESPAPTENASSNNNTYAINLDESGRALRGYDAVEYQMNGKAVEGKAEFQHEWAGAKWLFNNEENLKSFMSNPGNFVPANGGYCTFGVVLGKKFDGDPNVWSVQNDKLYVFLNDEVKEKFFQDLEKNLAKVDDNWVLIKDKSPKELE